MARLKSHTGCFESRQSPPPSNNIIILDAAELPSDGNHLHLSQAEREVWLSKTLAQITGPYDLFVMSHGDSGNVAGWGKYVDIFALQTENIHSVFIGACSSGTATEVAKALPVKGIPIYTSIADRALSNSTDFMNAYRDLEKQGFNFSTISPGQLFYKTLEFTDPEFIAWGSSQINAEQGTNYYNENPYEVMPVEIGVSGTSEINLQKELISYIETGHSFSNTAKQRVIEIANKGDIEWWRLPALAPAFYTEALINPLGFARSNPNITAETYDGESSINGWFSIAGDSFLDQTRLNNEMIAVQQRIDLYRLLTSDPANDTPEMEIQRLRYGNESLPVHPIGMIPPELLPTAYMMVLAEMEPDIRAQLSELQQGPETQEASLSLPAEEVHEIPTDSGLRMDIDTARSAFVKE